MDAIQWSYRETYASEYATFTVGKLKCVVQDCDGDFSVWNIQENGKVIVESKSIYDEPNKPYHFDAAKAEAEAALIIEAEKRGLYNSGPIDLM